MEMEKIKEFIQVCKESKKTRKMLSENLLECSFLGFDFQEASDFMNTMREYAEASGVLSCEEDPNGNIRVLIRFAKYLEITEEENRVVTWHEESERYQTTHYETVIDGIEIASVQSIWKKAKNASA